MPFSRLPALLPAAALGLALAACKTVGPDFTPPVAPAAPIAHPYTVDPLPKATASAPVPGGEAQQFVPGASIPAQWWALFRSEPLDRLVRGAIANSPNLTAAEAALRVAQENYNAEYGSRVLPGVDGQLGVTRQRSAQFGPSPSIFTLYNANVAVSYTVDAFGAVRRDLEAFGAAIDFQRFQLEAAYLALTANVVTTAIQEASLRAQIRATQDVLDSQLKSLDLLEKQARLGAIALSPVLAQRSQAAQTRAAIPALEKQLALQRNQLAVYAGQLPSEPGMPQFELDSLRLPVDLPVSLPSDLVRQRPDIRASEAQLHQASANVGVAIANLYPNITLSASAGPTAARIADLFSPAAFLWSIGASLAQPIFHGGALNARRRGAEAAFEQAGAQYRQVVLVAFQSVANALQALENDAEALRAQADAEALARRQLDLVERQFKIGATNYLVLLDAQRTYQQTRINLVQAKAARYADTAALFQALGGGWWNRTPQVSGE